MSKHTPGKWINKSAEGHYFGGAAAVNSADDKATIALVYGHPEEEMAANARLIAEAPAMYDLLLALSEDGNVNNKLTEQSQKSIQEILYRINH